MKDMPEEIYAWKSGIDGSGDKRWSDDRPENRSDRLINPIKYVRADRPSELRQAGDGMDEIRRTVNAVLGMQLDYEGPWSLGVSKHTPPELYGAEIGRCVIKLLNRYYAQPAAQKTPVDLQNQANLRDKEICTPQTISKQTEGSATSMQILEVGKDQYGEPLTVMGKPNAVHALQTALASRASVDVEAEKELMRKSWNDPYSEFAIDVIFDHLAARFPELVGGRE